jgi:hypothetical protein
VNLAIAIFTSYAKTEKEKLIKNIARNSASKTISFLGDRLKREQILASKFGRKTISPRRGVYLADERVGFRKTLIRRQTELQFNILLRIGGSLRAGTPKFR